MTGASAGGPTAVTIEDSRESAPTSAQYGDEQPYVLVHFVAEIHGRGEARERHAESYVWRLVQLAVASAMFEALGSVH